jgi:site-specific recombinase XerD
MNFEPFLTYWQTNKNCSQQTIRSYRNDLQLFQAFMQERGIRRITQVNHAVVNDYIKHMREKENPRFNRVGMSDATVRRRQASLCSYLEYTRATRNPKLHNPIRDFTQKWQKNDTPKPVDELILNQLLTGVTNLRDRVLLALFLATGFRVSEMRSLDRDTIKFHVDIDEADEETLSGTGEVLGKGNKLRTFFVDALTLELYAEYLDGRKDENPALFLSERKKRISVRAIQFMLATWCRKLGLSHTRVHQLRHSFATRLANAHIDSRILKDLMGHASLTTTQRYTKFHDTTLAQGYFSAMEFVNQQTPISTPEL